MQLARNRIWCFLLAGCWLSSHVLMGEPARKVIIDQDGMGPANTDQQSILMVLQASNVETLGITIVSGDQWRDEEVAHTLRMLELTGHQKVPVVPGAVFPLINTKAETARREKLYGRVLYQGAWNWGPPHEPSVVPPLPEGSPSLKPSQEDAAHFIVRMVHTYPHEISILAAGPLTNIALAIAIDSSVPDLAKELVFNGGKFNPQGIPYKYTEAVVHDFNFWWDPEAAHIVLRAPWHGMTSTPVDITMRTHMDKQLIDRVAKGTSPASRYIAKYAIENFMWDELTFAAWLDPSIITERETYYVDVEIDHGASYGDTLFWLSGGNPGLGEQPVVVNMNFDTQKFYDLFVDLMHRPSS
jgi:purine nucleosidase